MSAPVRVVCALAALALLASGCDGDADDDRRTESEPVDAPALPPVGWRTVRNAAAGFTVSAPRRWTVATERGSTLIRSDDRLVSVTISADRSEPGRELDAARYARETIRSLPGFRGSLSGRVRRVRSSPYATARVDATGRLRTSPTHQRITVAVFRRPGRVTYSAVVFRNAIVKPRFNDRRIDRLLRSLRAEKPRPERPPS